MKNRIIAIHLLNDRSGSPLVLKQALDVLRQSREIILYTSTPSGDGFLNDVDGINIRPVFYKWHSNKALTFFYFLLAQCLLFFRLLFEIRRSDTVYINTLLPFGAALAGYVRRVPIVYHIHEVSLKPEMLKKFLVQVADVSATRFIFVSDYVSKQYRFGKERGITIYNSLPNSFTNQAIRASGINLKHPFTVAMLCSLKAYKGVYHFINIAHSLPDIHFILVLNSSAEEVAAFREKNNVPRNCEISATLKNTIPVYKSVHMVVNLSRPDGWIETFGMTILEGMYCGRPAIVPPVGGICELVRDGIEGFRIDSRNENDTVKALRYISGDVTAYIRMANAALDRSHAFSFDVFAAGINSVFSSVSPVIFQAVTNNFHNVENSVMAKSV